MSWLEVDGVEVRSLAEGQSEAEGQRVSTVWVEGDKGDLIAELRRKAEGFSRIYVSRARAHIGIPGRYFCYAAICP